MSGVDCTNMTASQIDNLKVEAEKKLKAAQGDLHQVELHILEISRQIIDLEAQKQDYRITASKARQIVKELQSDIRVLTSEFWAAKDGR